MRTVSVTVTAAVESAELTAEAKDTVSAFFKAYTKVSPKLKKARSKADLALVEEATSALNKLSTSLGARPAGKKGKKGGFSNLKHASKKERMEHIEKKGKK